MSEVGQCLIQREQFVSGLWHTKLQRIEIKTLPVTAPIEPSPLAGLLDENAAHGLGGRGEEVPPAVPVLCLLRVHQP